MYNVELINRLRDVPCWDIGTEIEETMLDAAKALEVAEKRIATYQSDVADLEQREKELNDVLNERARLITELNTKCADLQSQIYSMESEIEELLSKEDKWVSVEDRLPLCGQDVLAARLYGSDADGWLHEVIIAHTSNVRYSVYWNATNITHWMPLPEAPKGKRE